LAWTADDLTRVESALAQGYTEVTFADGRRNRYGDIAQLLGLRNLIKSEMAAVAVSATVGGWPTNRRLARVSTGLASGGGDDAPAPWNRLYRWP
jgi:hypothetical protein